MKLKCIRNWIEDDSGNIKDLSKCLTLDKIYYTTNKTPLSEYVYNIIDDLGRFHDMSKDMFEDATAELRNNIINTILDEMG